jgi:hypothetical protein
MCIITFLDFGNRKMLLFLDCLAIISYLFILKQNKLLVRKTMYVLYVVVIGVVYCSWHRVFAADLASQLLIKPWLAG